MKKIKIYMITHKNNVNIPNGITPLFVGNGKNEKNFIRDNTGENISTKNNNYCELTGLYWIWKNDKSDIVGLCHYRRFFGKNKNDIYNENDERIENILLNNDIIVSPKWFVLDTVYKVYKTNHYGSDLLEVEKIIKEKYSDYLYYYKQIINGHFSYQCNMFICKKELIDKYCEWLFGILFELEKRIDLKNRDDYQKRIYGFLSERLLAVWILKNKLSVFEIPLYFTDFKFFDKIKCFVKKKYVKLILKIRGDIE